MNTCNGCTATWTAQNAAHCSVCHHTFSTVALFDAHRHGGRCLHPLWVLTKSGEKRMQFRNGMWRGPEMTEEQKARRFGDAYPGGE